MKMMVLFIFSRVRDRSWRKIQLIAAFQNEHPTVDIYCFNVAHVPDATATNDILHVINELNTSYRFAKFTLNKQNAIDISTSLAFSEPNFNPALVFEHTRMLYKLANDEYKNLMKVIWA